MIREYLRDDRLNELELDLGIGPITVWVEEDDFGRESFWMRQVQPTFGDRFSPSTLARVLGLDPTDVDDAHPVQLVSTGLPTVIVPFVSLDAVKRARTCHEPYYKRFIEPYGNLNVLMFAPETYDGNDLNVRVFADCAGMLEDPATGSSNGCLAAYLVEHGYFDVDDVQLTVDQGYEMNRPSLLRLRASRSRDGIDVRIGGRVIPVLEGRLL